MGLLNSRSSSSSGSSRSSSSRSSSSSSKKVSGVKLSISGSSSSSSRSPASSSSSKKVTNTSSKTSSSTGILKGSSSYSPKTSGSSSGILKPVSSPSSPKTSSSYTGILKPPATSHSSLSSSGSGILKSPGTSGSASLTLPSSVNKVTGTLQNAWDVPRRDAVPGFSGIDTSDSPGLIKSYYGGKLGKDGIVRYPNGVNVDKAHAARSQAFFDVAYGDSTSGRSDMAALYGDDYTNEVRRLANMKTGDLSWAELPANQRPNLSVIPSGRVPDENDNLSFDYGPSYSPPSGGNSFRTDLDSILSAIGSNSNGYDNSYLKDYLEAIEESKNASAEALRKQIEQGLAQLNSQKDSINHNFANAAQQNYINAMLSQRDLPQQMAAQGLNGGATESANLALLTNYQDNQNSLAETHSQNLAQIAQEIAELYATGNINLSNLEAAYGKETAKAILEAGQQAANLQSQKDMALFKARIQAILSQASQQWQAQQDAANRQWKSQYAQDQANREYDLWLKKLQAQQT